MSTLHTRTCHIETPCSNSAWYIRKQILRSALHTRTCHIETLCSNSAWYIRKQILQYSLINSWFVFLQRSSKITIMNQNKFVKDNQSSLTRYIQCSNTACDTRTKTPQLIQKKKSQQFSRLDIGNQKYHQSINCDFVN